MITIYHNPRCRKSREGLALVEASGKPYRIVNYLEDPFSRAKLKEILSLLGIAPKALIRRNEAIWKQRFKDKVLPDDALIEAMVAHPKLIERPIVVYGNKAVIGRPPEKIKTLLKG